MSVDVEQVASDLVAEQDALDAIGEGLAPEQWNLATPSPGWTVAAQIGHLAYFDGGTGPDQAWRPENDGTSTLEVQVGYNAADAAIALAGTFTNTSFGSLFFYRPGSGAELLLR